MPTITQKVTIKNVAQISSVQHLSDSIQKVLVSFEIASDHLEKTDSIMAIIKTKKIQIDDKEVIATKISFSKNNSTINAH